MLDEMGGDSHNHNRVWDDQMQDLVNLITNMGNRMNQMATTQQQIVTQLTQQRPVGNEGRRGDVVGGLGEGVGDNFARGGNYPLDEFRAPRGLEYVKLQMPTFTGGSSVDDYLDWESKVERVFERYEIDGYTRVKLASVKFTGYVALWWRSVKDNRRIDGASEIRTWQEMKRVLRRRFVPEYYQHELSLRLQTLRQGSNTVEEYIQEFETLMERSGTAEPSEQTVARFVTGLKYEISCIVELHRYDTLEEAIQLALTVERQRRTNPCETFDSEYDSSIEFYGIDRKNVEQEGFSKNVDKGKAIVEAKVEKGVEENGREVVGSSGEEIPKSDNKEQVESIDDVDNKIDEEATDDMSNGNGEDLSSLVMGRGKVDMPMSLQEADVIPLTCAFGTAKSFRYPYMFFPSFHPIYSDALMGLPSMRSYCDCIIPMGCYAIFVGVHWSIMDGYLYWRSVLVVHGIIIEQMVILARRPPRLPILRGYIKATHANNILRSIHGSELIKRDYLSAGILTSCIVRKDCSGAIIDESIYSYMCWKHDVCYLIVVLGFIANNLGDRGKCKELRDIHCKHECERYMRAMRDLKHTCEGNHFLSISNSSLQVTHYPLKMLELCFVAALRFGNSNLTDLRTNLHQSPANDVLRIPMNYKPRIESRRLWRIAWKPMMRDAKRSTMKVIHSSDEAHEVKFFYLQDLRANLLQHWANDENQFPIVFLKLYEILFEWKIAWKLKKQAAKDHLQLSFRAGLHQGRPKAGQMPPAFIQGRP